MQKWCEIFFLWLLLLVGSATLGNAQNKTGETPAVRYSGMDTLGRLTRVQLLLTRIDSFYRKDKGKATAYAQEAVGLLDGLQNDSIKWKVYTYLHRLYYTQKIYSKSQPILDSIVFYAERIDDPWLRFTSYYRYGGWHRIRREYDEAILYYEKALALNDEHDREDWKIDLNQGLAFAYRNRGLMEKAAERFLMNAKMTERAGKTKQFANTSFWLADLYYRMGKLAVSLQYLEQALEMWEALGNKAGLFDVYSLRAKVYESQGDFGKAFETYDLALANAQEDADRSIVQTNRGIMYKNMGEFDKALAAYDLAEELIDIEKDSFGYYALVANRAIVYQRRGAYDLALSHFQKELNYRERMEMPHKTGAAYRRMCAIYIKLEDFDLAETYAQKALAIAEKIEDRKGLTNINVYFGEIAFSRARYQRAEQFFRKANNLAISLQERLAEINSLSLLGEALWEQGRLKEALELQFEVLGRLDPDKEKLFYVTTTRRIAGHLLRLKQEENKELKQVFQPWAKFDIQKHLKKALSNAETVGDFTHQEGLYHVLADFYEYKKDFAQALIFRTKYAAIKDSVFTKEKAIALAEMQTKYETERTAKEAELLKIENQLIATRNQYYITAAVILLVLLSIGAMLYWQLGRAKNKLQLQNVTIEAQNLELQSLNKTKDRFFGIIAHDLRSPILAFQGVGQQISYYVKKKDNARLASLGTMVNQTAVKLNRLLDNLLSWALLQTGKTPYHPQLIAVSELLEEIQALFLPVAQTKQLRLVFYAAPNLAVYADENALETSLRNLVSNAIKFTEEGGTIWLKAYQENQQIIFTIKDSGIGMEAATLEKMFSLQTQSMRGTAGERGTGLGLLLCKELTALNGGTIRVESSLGKGTCFYLSFPLKKELSASA